MPLISINPSTGKKIQSYPTINLGQARQVAKLSHESFLLWKQVSFEDRAAVLLRVADLLLEKKEFLAKLMAFEMGKPVVQGIAEIEKCALNCQIYAEKAEEYLEAEWIETDASRSYVSFQPMGVILGIMPWNYPFWQVFRFIAPTLMAGNGILLKHAPNVTGCALAIDEILNEAGLPKNLYEPLVMEEGLVESLIESEFVQAVTLTGSQRAGRIVAAKAGSELKKCVLELGGSDPYLVLKEAKASSTAQIAADNRVFNSGQVCISAKRLIVVEKHYDEFLKSLVQFMSEKKMGSPFEVHTDLGPLARRDLREALDLQVKESIDKGARLHLGGEVPKGEGFFYPPTVLSEITEDMPVYREEVFGPVAVVIKAKDNSDAIRIANDTTFGLGAVVFTEDIEEGEEIARDQINAGACFVNCMVKSDPDLPFGGIKGSGFGRELGSYGIKEFCNIKTVYVK